MSFSDRCEQFTGYGIATSCQKEPAIDWNGDNTYIQCGEIADDFVLVFSQVFFTVAQVAIFLD